MAGGTGKCDTTMGGYYFDSKVHYGDELAFTPNYAISWSGCNLRCQHCITAPYSYHGKSGSPLPLWQGAKEMEKCFSQGCTHLHFLGGEPTLQLPVILQFLEYIRPEVTVMMNSNFYFASPVLPLLQGLIHHYLADVKYGNNDCAQRFSQVPLYWETVTHNVLEARLSGNVVIRHLLLPGHFDCCFVPLVEWLSQHCPDRPLSLHGQFVPPEFTREDGALGRFLTDEEYQEAQALARSRGLTLLS